MHETFQNSNESKGLVETFTRLRWNLRRRLVVFRATISLKKESEASHSPSEWVDIASTFHRRLRISEQVRNELSIAPTQIKSEIVALMHIVEKLGPRQLLEVGTANGGTLFLFTRVAAPGATLIGIDLPKKRYGNGIPSWRTRLYSAFSSRRQKVHLIRQDSHSLGALEKVEAILKGRELDFLFIDGDHSYIGVAKDFGMYSSLVRRGGIVAFHDIIPDYKTRYGLETTSNAGEVYRFWSELKTKHRVSEIVSNPDQDGFGIGVLTKDNN